MIEPYKLILINSIAILLLGVGIVFYKYIYPKKNLNLFILLLVLSLLPLISLLRTGTYESGDFSINVSKSMSFYSSLLDGNILPHWAGELNATYGYPLFIFTYPLPYYIVSFFHFFHFSFISSLKLLIATSFIASGIGMYYWAKEEISKGSAFIAAIFYLYAPYHLVDTHFRISIGEIVSFALLPFILFFIKKWMKYGSITWFSCIALGISLLLLCNPAISLVAFIFIGVYAFFTWHETKKKKISSLVSCFFACSIGLLLSAFYWFPVVAESVYTHEPDYIKTISYVQLSELFYSPWRFGLLFQGPEGQLSFLIGYAQLFIIILSVFYLLRNKFNHIEKRQVIFYLSLILICCFMLLPYSAIIWNTISILRNFQFTSRLLLFVALFTSMLVAILATKLKKWMIILLCTFAILQTILNWGNRRTIPSINDAVLQSELPLSTAAGEGFQPASPVWTDPNAIWEGTIPKQHLQILTGKATINNLKRSSTKHEYVVNVLTPTMFKENTVYFPNWTVFVNNKSIPIIYQYKKYPGIITFGLKPGLYKIDVVFLNTPVQNWSLIISMITFVAGCLMLLQRLIVRKGGV